MADPIQQLVQHLSRLPGIGEKTAARLAFHLVRSPESQVRDLAQALVEVVEKIRLCSVCMNITEQVPCQRCSDPQRIDPTICVVSSPSDVVAIDRGGHFQGRYHVLHGVLSPLDGVGPEDLRIDELMQRLSASADTDEQVTEVIIATSANVEGEATAMYLARLIKPMNIRVSRIASGIPVGGELEYSDQATIARALQGRLPL
ncbi:recombination mediator RecR [Haliangium sp.]|uniref:recombination mediator RecR n=1 Tax=Haliangium sp. TaxID=2663208 RepID=UPI003D0FF120